MTYNAVELRKTDSCLTYVLRRLGLLESYRDLDGDEFLGKYRSKLVRIVDISEAREGDIIVVKNKGDHTLYDYFSIDEQGRIFTSSRDTSIHFMLCEGRFTTDISRKDSGVMIIRVRETKEYYIKDDTEWYLLNKEHLQQ